MKLETGAKSTFAHFDNNIRFEQNHDQGWVIDTSLTQHVQLNEKIWAGYVNLSSQVSPNNRFQAGLRYEHTLTDLFTIDGQSLVHRNYGNWFPTLFWVHTLTPSSSFQLAYSQRISRPTFNQLAPYLYFADPTTSGSGNERLLPTLSKNIQAIFRFSKNALLTLEHTWFKNPIAYNVLINTADNRQLSRPDNLDQAQNLSVSLSMPLTLTHWWQMQTSLLGVRQVSQLTQDGLTQQQRQVYGRLTSTQTFQLPHGFSAELSGFYQSSGLIGLMVRHPFGVLNVGIKKQLPNQRGSLRLSGEDLLWSNFVAYEFNNPAKGYSITSGGRGNNTRLVRLTYTRSFGNQKVKVNSTRATGSDDERRRVN
jgi:hypothetical protein